MAENTYTLFQEQTIAELQAMKRAGMISAKIADRAVVIVQTNKDCEFSDASCMGISDAADLAVDLAMVQS